MKWGNILKNHSKEGDGGGFLEEFLATRCFPRSRSFACDLRKTKVGSEDKGKREPTMKKGEFFGLFLHFRPPTAATKRRMA